MIVIPMKDPNEAENAKNFVIGTFPTQLKKKQLKVDTDGNKLIIVNPNYTPLEYSESYRVRTLNEALSKFKEEELSVFIPFPSTFTKKISQEIGLNNFLKRSGLKYHYNEWSRQGTFSLPSYLSNTQQISTETIIKSQSLSGEGSLCIGPYTLHAGEIVSNLKKGYMKYTITKDGKDIKSGTAYTGDSINFGEGKDEITVNVKDITIPTSSPIEKKGSETCKPDLGVSIDGYDVYVSPEDTNNGKAYIYCRTPEKGTVTDNNVEIGDEIVIDDNLKIKVTAINWDPEPANQSASFGYTLSTYETTPASVIVNGSAKYYTPKYTYQSAQEYFASLEGKEITTLFVIGNEKLSVELGLTLNNLLAAVGEEESKKDYLSLVVGLSANYGPIYEAIKGDIGKFGEQLFLKFGGNVELIPGSKTDFTLLYKRTGKELTWKKDGINTALGMLDNTKEIKISQELFNDIKKGIKTRFALVFSEHDNTLRLEKYNPELTKTEVVIDPKTGEPEIDPITGDAVTREVLIDKAKAENYIKERILTPTLDVEYKGVKISGGVGISEGEIVGREFGAEIRLPKGWSTKFKIKEMDKEKRVTISLNYKF